METCECITLRLCCTIIIVFEIHFIVPIFLYRHPAASTKQPGCPLRKHNSACPAGGTMQQCREGGERTAAINAPPASQREDRAVPGTQRCPQGIKGTLVLHRGTNHQGVVLGGRVPGRPPLFPFFCQILPNSFIPRVCALLFLSFLSI